MGSGPISGPKSDALRSHFATRKVDLTPFPDRHFRHYGSDPKSCRVSTSRSTPGSSTSMRTRSARCAATTAFAPSSARERRELGAARRAEADRVAAPAGVERRRDGRAAAQRVSDAARSSPAGSTACRRARRSSPASPATRAPRRRGSRPCRRRRGRTRRRAPPPPPAPRPAPRRPDGRRRCTSGTAATRFRHAATPTASPAAAPGSAASSLSPPKRVAAARGEQDADDAHAARPAGGSLRQQPELPVLHRDQHARALVHAVVVGRATC